jgi:hypothetical protein
MRVRFLEAEDNFRTNHGKFQVCKYEPTDFQYVSPLSRRPLLSALPMAQRFQGPIGAGDLWLLDLQTREGCLFDPTLEEAALRQQFLIHPLHVCILFFPVMCFLAAWKRPFGELPPLVTLSTEEALKQPGLLVDRFGEPVESFSEWCRRGCMPLAARLRNREVAAGGDPEEGQNVLTQVEQQASRLPKPVW